MNVHTIFMLVGAIASGKSTLATKMQQALSQNHTCEVISSDGIRRMLLDDYTIPNNHASMDSVSGQAFRIFDALLESYISYPVNRDFIILDTTGMGEAFRNEVLKKAEKHQYNVELVVLDVDYKELKSNADARDERMYQVMQSKKRLRQEVLPNLNRKAYSKVHILKSLEKLDAFPATLLTPKTNWPQIEFGEDEKVAVISDVHECMEEMYEMMDRLLAEGVKGIFFVGDMIDKGEDTPGLMKFMGELASNGGFYKEVPLYMARGNHERYVYKALKGEIEKNEELENSYFTSLAYLRANQDQADLFMKIYEEGMNDYMIIKRGHQRAVVVTHAPCLNKHIAKMDAGSLKAMNNFYFKSRVEEDMLNELKFIEEEMEFNHPFHVFGHVAHTSPRPVRKKNKIFLDTGCVHGGTLSAVVFNKHYVDFLTVDSKERNAKGGRINLNKEQSALEKVASKEVRLSDDEEKILKRILKGGARYISGTMVPAPSSGTDIESLEEGLKIFAEFNDSVILQPKYMGSRAQAYLHTDRSSNFATSRNGFRINVPGIEVALGELQDRLEARGVICSNIVLDCELLPWAGLGSKLIDGSFRQYEECLKHAWNNLRNDEEFKKFGVFTEEDLDRKVENAELFSRQVELYGQSGPLLFKPFNILEMGGVNMTTDGDNFENFAMISDDDSLIIEFSEEGWLEKARKFFIKKTYSQGYEGVVVKPRYTTAGRLPYMKIRNKEYLRIVYGFDYDAPGTLEKLCRQKNIKGKSRLAIKEFELGSALMDIGYDDPTLRRKIVAEMMGCMSQEKSLDPRL